jgi:hypothetical protein
MVYVLAQRPRLFHSDTAGKRPEYAGLQIHPTTGETDFIEH